MTPYEEVIARRRKELRSDVCYACGCLCLALGVIGMFKWGLGI